MMIFFIILLVVSIWKVYAFLPNKILEDDDRTDEVEAILKNIMLKIIKKNKHNIDKEKLFLEIIEDEKFDNKLFWRFNKNRLNQLLSKYYPL